jgi:hypothetical protein
MYDLFARDLAPLATEDHGGISKVGIVMQATTTLM